jgi:hypothetical protein
LEVVDSVDQIKIWIFGDKRSEKLVLPRLITPEYSTGKPDFEYFLEKYNRDPSRPLIVLQLHPKGYDDSDFHEFESIIEFLLDKGAQFTTPSDYLEMVSSSETVYENAEDGTIDGWDIYDNDPPGAIIENVYDDDRQSRVIQLSGYTWRNGYRLRNTDGSKWHNSEQFVIEWNMKYSESFSIYIDVQTTAGRRVFQYNAMDDDLLGDELYVRHGLGKDAKDGQWHTFLRDLEKDLHDAQPHVDILEVNAFQIRGNGCIDDIKLRNDF